MIFTIPTNNLDMDVLDDKLFDIAMQQFPNAKNPMGELILRLKIVAESFPFESLRAFSSSDGISFAARPLSAVECQAIYNDSYVKALSANQLIRTMLQPMSRVVNTFCKEYINEDGKSPNHPLIRDLLDTYLRHSYEATAGGVADHVFYTHQEDPNTLMFNRLVLSGAKLIKGIGEGIYNYQPYDGEMYNEVHGKAQIFNGTEDGIAEVNAILAERICFEVHERLEAMMEQIYPEHRLAFTNFKDAVQGNATLAALFLHSWLEAINDFSDTDLSQLLDAVENIRRENRSLIPALKASSQCVMWITNNIKQSSNYVMHMLVDTNTGMLQLLKSSDKPNVFGLPEDLFTKLDNASPTLEDIEHNLGFIRQVSYKNDVSAVLQALRYLNLVTVYYGRRESQAKEKGVREPIFDIIRNTYIPLAHNPELKPYVNIHDFRKVLMKEIDNANAVWLEAMYHEGYLDIAYLPLVQEG